MALVIDSKKVMDAILSRPDVFTAVKAAEVNEIARKMLIKQIKDKATDADRLKSIFAAVGEESVSTVLDEFASKDLCALVKKIDAHSPHGKAGTDENEARAHVISVGLGRAGPAPKPEKPAPAKTAKSPRKAAPPKSGAVLQSKVHSGAKPRAGKAKA